jgi:hypothetical protein
VQTPRNKVQIERPAKENEDLASNRQTPKNKNEGPHRKVLPDEKFEKRV